MFGDRARVGRGFGLLAASVMVINFAVWGAGLWLMGSLIASGVKTANGNCGQEYGVPLVAQDWFCPKK